MYLEIPIPFLTGVWGGSTRVHLFVPQYITQGTRPAVESPPYMKGQVPRLVLSTCNWRALYM